MPPEGKPVPSEPGHQARIIGALPRRGARGGRPEGPPPARTAATAGPPFPYVARSAPAGSTPIPERRAEARRSVTPAPRRQRPPAPAASARRSGDPPREMTVDVPNLRADPARTATIAAAFVDHAAGASPFPATARTGAPPDTPYTGAWGASQAPNAGARVKATGGARSPFMRPPCER